MLVQVARPGYAPGSPAPTAARRRAACAAGRLHQKRAGGIPACSWCGAPRRRLALRELRVDPASRGRPGGRGPHGGGTRPGVSRRADHRGRRRAEHPGRGLRARPRGRDPRRRAASPRAAIGPCCCSTASGWSPARACASARTACAGGRTPRHSRRRGAPDRSGRRRRRAGAGARHAARRRTTPAHEAGRPPSAALPARPCGSRPSPGAPDAGGGAAIRALLDRARRRRSARSETDRARSRAILRFDYAHGRRGRRRRCAAEIIRSATTRRKAVPALPPRRGRHQSLPLRVRFDDPEPFTE